MTPQLLTNRTCCFVLLFCWKTTERTMHSCHWVISSMCRELSSRSRKQGVALVMSLFSFCPTYIILLLFTCLFFVPCKDPKQRDRRSIVVEQKWVLCGCSPYYHSPERLVSVWWWCCVAPVGILLLNSGEKAFWRVEKCAVDEGACCSDMSFLCWNINLFFSLQGTLTWVQLWIRFQFLDHWHLKKTRTRCARPWITVQSSRMITSKTVG